MSRRRTPFIRFISKDRRILFQTRVPFFASLLKRIFWSTSAHIVPRARRVPLLLRSSSFRVHEHCQKHPVNYRLRMRVDESFISPRSHLKALGLVSTRSALPQTTA